MADLDNPYTWKLKGQGNANIVFAYTGNRQWLVRIYVRICSNNILLIIDIYHTSFYNDDQWKISDGFVRAHPGGQGAQSP